MIHHPIPPVLLSDEDRVVIKFGAVEYRLTLDEATDMLTDLTDAWREAYDWDGTPEHDPFEMDDTRPVSNT